MRGEEFRRPEPLLALQVVGYDRPARAQRIARWGLNVSADACDANEALVPTHSGAHQQPIFRWHVLQDLAEFSLQTISCNAHSLVQQVRKWSSPQGGDTKFSQKLLLADTLPKGDGSGCF